MQRVAVFLDAGYFFAQVSKSLGVDVGRRELIELDYKALRAEILAEVARQFPGTPLLRVYWYDGPGAHGKNNTHKSIDELDDFKLKLGARNGFGEQKEVDGLIIADMLGLVYAKALSDILLVSGDADITPGVVAAQAQGARVHVLAIGSVTAMSGHLRAEADHKASWSDEAVRAFASVAQERQPKPLDAPCFDSGIDFAALAAQFAQANPGHGLEAFDANERILPKEIDAPLLYFAKNFLGRPLENGEKRCLRDGLRHFMLARLPLPGEESAPALAFALESDLRHGAPCVELHGASDGVEVAEAMGAAEPRLLAAEATMLEAACHDARAILECAQEAGASEDSLRPQQN